MRVRSIHLVGFGKLQNCSYNFNDTLNIITGMNEAGKTTMVNAIMGILYGFKGRSDEIRALKERYRPWDRTVPYMANMVANFGEPFDYLIERNFEEDTVTVHKLHDGQTLPSNLTIEEILNEKLGLGSGKLFKSTLLIKQEEVAELHRTELADAIIRKITESGSGVSVKEILQTLADRMKELYRGFGRPTPNPGPLKDCLEKIKKLKAEITELRSFYQEYNEMLHLYNRKQAERGSVQERIAFLHPLVQEYEQKEASAARLDFLKERLGILTDVHKRVIKKQEEIAAITENLELYRENALTQENLQELEFLDRKLTVTEQRIDQLNYEFQKLKGKRQLIQREMGNHSKTIASFYSVRYNEKNLAEARRLMASVTSLLEETEEKEARLKDIETSPQKRFTASFWIGVALCCFSAAGLFIGSIWGYVLASIVLVSGVMVIYFGGINSQYGLSRELARITNGELQRIKTNVQTYQRMLDGILDGEDLESYETKVKEQIHLKQKIHLLEEELRSIEVEPLEQELDDFRSDLNKYLHQISDVLTAANAGSVEDFREQLERVRELKTQLKLAQDTVQIVLKDNDVETLNEEVTLIEKEIAVMTANKANEEVTQEQYEAYKQELDKLENIFELAREEEIKIAASVENYNRLIIQDRDIWSLETSLSDKEAELKKFEIEGKGIELAIKLIQEATEEARANLAPQVKDKVIKIFQWITKKRYRDVRLEMEGDNLVLQYLDNEFEEYRDVHFLSTGTRDQLYLALRIALGEYLTKCNTFPLFLDDPFVNFDNERMVKTVEILRLLAREHQIIWLTKDGHLTEDIQEASLTQLQ